MQFKPHPPPHRRSSARSDYRTGRNQDQRRLTPAPTGGFSRVASWIAEHPLLLGLIAALVIALLSEMPWLSRDTRAHLLQGLVVAFFVLVAGAGSAREDLKAALRRGPNPWILALLGWSILCAALSPYRAFAVAELLRVFFCAGVYFTAAYGLRSNELRPVVFTVLGLGTMVALLSPLRFSAAVGTDITQSNGIFGNHEQFGSFVALLLIVALALALDRSDDRRVLLGAQALAVPLAGALLLARTRAAWIGELAGLVTLTFFVLRYTSLRINRANRSAIVGPALILCVGFAMLAFSGQIAPLISQRATTFMRVVEDVSFADRLHRWKSACRMAYERPVTGWGLGAFPVIQERWTGNGDETSKVLAQGTGHSNLAHNFWVQWAAETGGVGVALYVGLVAAFLLSAGPLVKTLRPGFRRTLLIGCLAATVTACADMVGAPSYTFPGVSSLPWLWMGLGLAACRAPEPGRDEDGTPALPPTPPFVWIGAALAGLGVALLLLYIGSRQPSANANDAEAAAFLLPQPKCWKKMGVENKYWARGLDNSSASWYNVPSCRPVSGISRLSG